MRVICQSAGHFLPVTSVVQLRLLGVDAIPFVSQLSHRFAELHVSLHHYS